MPSVMYRQYGHRKWIEQVFQDRCDCPVDVFGGKCQGVKGHQGHHWCYNEGGWLVERPQESEKDKYDWGLSSTPPDHKNYVSPTEKQSEYYLSFNTSREVTDQQLIDKLEKDEYIGEDVSIDRMVTEEDMDKPFGYNSKTLRELLEER